MSSPNINNIILFGCILAYLSVFIEDVNNTVDSIYCKVKPVLLLLAFSLSFGALFAKTWRIHAVFTAGLRLKKRSIKDSTLCLMVLVLVCLNCLILIVWFSADPLTISSTDASEEEKIEDDMRIQYVHNHCWSSKQNIFLIAILVIQGIFLLLGVFLAWETRKVKLSILNESRYIGMCIYNVMTLGIIGVLVSYSLNSHPSTVYVIISCITILSSTVTQCLLFVPKIKMYRDFVKGKLKDMSTINTSDQCVPLRPGRVTVATQTDVVVTNGLELTE